MAKADNKKNASLKEARAEEVHTSAPARKNRLGQELVLGSLVAELIGTFTLAAFILSYMTLLGAGNPLYVIFAAIAIYLVFWRLSGAHLNPAITVGMLAIRKISWIRGVGYIIAQLLGAMLAYIVVSQFVQSAPVGADSLQTAPTLYSITANEGDTWRPFWGEAVGALLLGIGFAAAALSRRSDAESSLAIGGMYYVGLFIASLSSAAILNPALGLALGAYQTDNAWTIWQYAAGPVVGAVIGIAAYKLLKWDVTVKE